MLNEACVECLMVVIASAQRGDDSLKCDCTEMDTPVDGHGCKYTAIERVAGAKFGMKNSVHDKT